MKKPTLDKKETRTSRHSPSFGAETWDNQDMASFGAETWDNQDMASNYNSQNGL